MSKIFEKIGADRPRMSAFDLSHERKLSLKAGDLVPMYRQDILPGDKFKVQSEMMARMAPMIAPIQHRVNIYVHYFFVPNRIIWSSWEDFITGGVDGLSAPSFPKYNMNSVATEYSDDMIGTLADYLGLPTNMNSAAAYNGQISQLPFRAYQMIWNEFFRDETLNPDISASIQNGSFTECSKLRKRAWEKDYFTSALPWTQRGPEVTLPTEFSPQYLSQSESPNAAGVVSADGGSPSKLETPTDPVQVVNLTDPQTGISISIQDLRQSSALQRWLEKQARGGYRYIETILSHFGVRSSDARLQRPEYLGGGRQPVVISEVLNTSDTATAAQGTMAGHGISTGATNSFKKTFEEHGQVIGVMSILPRTSYQQGVHRDWKRFDKEDFYWPEFANLGEQEVLNEEVYMDETDGTYSLGTFGYQQKYAEYKYAESSVHGEYRNTLDFWHWGRIFTGQPNLNAGFVEADPDDRIFAVADKEQFYVQIYNAVKARRAMPYYAKPTLR